MAPFHRPGMAPPTIRVGSPTRQEVFPYRAEWDYLVRRQAARPAPPAT